MNETCLRKCDKRGFKPALPTVFVSKAQYLVISRELGSMLCPRSRGRPKRLSPLFSTGTPCYTARYPQLELKRTHFKECWSLICSTFYSLQLGAGPPG